jgi:hypothetical protein
MHNFLSVDPRHEPELLPVVNDAAKPPPQPGQPAQAAILERNGLPVINNSLLKPSRETEAGLDANFRKLVDSVIKKPGKIISSKTGD